MKFMVHVEWKERVPGQPLLQLKERTVERHARSIMDALNKAKREFPGTRITVKQMAEVRT